MNDSISSNALEDADDPEFENKLRLFKAMGGAFYKVAPGTQFITPCEVSKNLAKAKSLLRETRSTCDLEPS